MGKALIDFLTVNMQMNILFCRIGTGDSPLSHYRFMKNADLSDLTIFRNFFTDNYGHQSMSVVYS